MCVYVCVCVCVCVRAFVSRGRTRLGSRHHSLCIVCVCVFVCVCECVCVPPSATAEPAWGRATTPCVF